MQDGQSLSADKLSPVTIRICQRASRSKKWTRVSDMMARFLLRVAKSGAPSCCLDEGDGK